MAVPKERIVIEAAQVVGAIRAEHEAILTPAALAFLGQLHRRFDARRQYLLAQRRERQALYDAGQLPDFRADTRAIRDAPWRVGAIPAALRDRRVEITGPVERKMIINALNSGAKVFMADFEDSSAPSLANQLDGQINLHDAVRGSIQFSAPDGKHYRLNDNPAVLIVRPRGWHLPERHLIVDGSPMSGALVDFGLFVFHNAHQLHQRERGPYFYLPKLEAMEEAALWNEVMTLAEHELDLPQDSIKATVLIETLPAVFQMHEILHALRGRAVGLNCGRWDYIFSYLKTFRAHRDRLLPERGQVQMTVPFLKAYSELLIQTCHRRGAFAMGGMAAQIPIKGDEAANTAAMEKVRADKLREVQAGREGNFRQVHALAQSAQCRAGGCRYHARPADRAVRRFDQSRRFRQQRGSGLALYRRMAGRPGLRADSSPDGRCGHRGNRAFAVMAMAAPRRRRIHRSRANQPGPVRPGACRPHAQAA
jgi:malate synthase